MSLCEMWNFIAHKTRTKLLRKTNMNRNFILRSSMDGRVRNEKSKCQTCISSTWLVFEQVMKIQQKKILPKRRNIIKFQKNEIWTRIYWNAKEHLQIQLKWTVFSKLKNLDVTKKTPQISKTFHMYVKCYCLHSVLKSVQWISTNRQNATQHQKLYDFHWTNGQLHGYRLWDDSSLVMLLWFSVCSVIIENCECDCNVQNVLHSTKNNDYMQFERPQWFPLFSMSICRKCDIEQISREAHKALV